MTERVMEMIGFQLLTRDKLGDDYDVNGMRLLCKMISKIQLIGNKQVTLFVKLNR